MKTPHYFRDSKGVFMKLFLILLLVVTGSTFADDYCGINLESPQIIAKSNSANGDNNNSLAPFYFAHMMLRPSNTMTLCYDNFNFYVVAKSSKPSSRDKVYVFPKHQSYKN